MMSQWHTREQLVPTVKDSLPQQCQVRGCLNVSTTELTTVPVSHQIKQWVSLLGWNTVCIRHGVSIFYPTMDKIRQDQAGCNQTGCKPYEQHCTSNDLWMDSRIVSSRNQWMCHAAVVLSVHQWRDIVLLIKAEEKKWWKCTFPEVSCKRPCVLFFSPSLVHRPVCTAAVW